MSSSGYQQTCTQVSHKGLNVTISECPQGTAYTHSTSPGFLNLPRHSPLLCISHPDIVPDLSSMSSSSGSAPPPLDLYFDLALKDVPASSTPDLVSPEGSAPSSPEISLVEQAFAKRLHSRLQAILDQQGGNQESSVDGSASQSECSHENYGSMVLRNNGCDSQTLGDLEQKDLCVYSDQDETSSATSSGNSFCRCAFSPKPRSLLEGIYRGAPLTRKNKRKHDFSYEFSHGSSINGDVADAEEEELLPERKKAKLGGRPCHVATTVNSQENETVSPRKLRTPTSATSSFSSTVSTVVKSPPFQHPIIHPPSNAPDVPKTTIEMAEARIKTLLMRETSYRIQDGFPLAGTLETPNLSLEEHESTFGLEPDFRRKVVAWILDIMPPQYLNSQDLYQHLQCSEETRFHAMYLFSRFFLRLAEHGDPLACRKLKTKSMKLAKEEITWDVAFCCLAISTKFYHDTLSPLNPIHSRHFLAIAPQLLSHRQFEAIQRDVLDAFDYEVHGLTPHAFFDELWNALPSLREILRYRCTRVNIRDEMWETLRTAALECDVLRFPVSLLAAAALIESILVMLVYDYECEDDRKGKTDTELPATRLQKNCAKARERIKDISQDISKILRTSTTDLVACRRWLSSMKLE